MLLYFVRRSDGGALVIDVRADERIEDGDAGEVPRPRLGRAG